LPVLDSAAGFFVPRLALVVGIVILFTVAFVVGAGNVPAQSVASADVADTVPRSAPPVDLPVVDPPAKAEPAAPTAPVRENPPPAAPATPAPPPVPEPSVPPAPPPAAPPAEAPKAPAEAPPVAPPPAAVPAKPAPAVGQRQRAGDEELRRQLMYAPELGLQNRTAQTLVTAALMRQQQQQASESGVATSAPVVPVRGANNRQPTNVSLATLSVTDVFALYQPELTTMPLRKGHDCRLGKEPSENLHVLSRRLRDLLGEVTPKDGVDPRPDPVKLRAALLGDASTLDLGRLGRLRLGGEPAPAKEWLQAAAIPALQQLLQAENAPVRLVLVEALALIPGKEASVALAERAVFDLASPVRERALDALKDRPREDVRATFLEAFRYPWPAAAEHAAEALAVLNDQGAVPALEALLDEPDPRRPFVTKASGKETTAVRELVRVNHLANCLMCHAPSLRSDDLVRGRVPVQGQSLSAGSTPAYYGGDSGVFVRADVSYLKQDFSVVQPVENPGAWPSFQRFDYLVRTRPATREDRLKWSKPETDGQRTYREAVEFALKALRSESQNQQKLEDVQRRP
jgi:hypothetical protein